MAGRVHGNDPRPWALVYGVEDDSEFGKALVELFPTVLFAEWDQAVRFPEFDVVVAVGTPPFGVARRSHVLQFGGEPSARVGGWHLHVQNGAHARLFSTEGTADDLAALADATLIPKAGVEYEVLRFVRQTVTAGDQPELESFAQELGGSVLAGRALRGRESGSGEIWWLPDWAERRGDWAALALRRWQARDPEYFPRADAWREDAEWMTAAEKAARDALDAHREMADARIAELLAETDRLAGDLQDARDAADGTERLLLTSQGEELAKAVAAALEDLGFAVEDADALPAHAAAKMEDLRVRDEDWICLAEVKGYSKRGAKAGDLLQLGRAVESFILAEGRRPDARWYVINQLTGVPPGERPAPLQGSPDVEPFGTSGGLVIDTRDLFRLRESVRRGDLSPDSARELLREARGVLTFPLVEGAL